METAWANFRRLLEALDDAAVAAKFESDAEAVFADLNFDDEDRRGLRPLLARVQRLSRPKAAALLWPGPNNAAVFDTVTVTATGTECSYDFVVVLRLITEVPRPTTTKRVIATLETATRREIFDVAPLRILPEDTSIPPTSATFSFTRCIKNPGTYALALTIDDPEAVNDHAVTISYPGAVTVPYPGAVTVP